MFLARHVVQRFQQVRPIQTVENIKKANQTQSLFVQKLLTSDVDLLTHLQSKKPLSQSDWKKARKDLLKFDYLNKNNVDAAITNLCSTFENNDAILSYINFLKNNDYEINLYMSATFANIFLKKSSLNDVEKQEIYAMYDRVRKKYPILDAVTCQKFIQVLCLTDRWKEAIELLDMMEMSTPINSLALSSIISAAFLHGETDIALKYMSLANEKKMIVFSKAYERYIEYCSKTFKDEKSLEKNLLKMFEFLKKYNTVISEDILNQYLKIYEHLGYTHSHVSIDHT